MNQQAPAWKIPGPQFGPETSPSLPVLPSKTTTQGPAPDSGQWWEYASPFRHFGATDVLDPETYAQISHQFALILNATHGEGEGKYKLKKIRGNYDALILGLNDELANLFTPLLTEDWLRPVADFMGLEFVPRIEGALHSNPQGSGTGWIHTDLCSGWFDEHGKAPQTLMLPPRGRCNYFTGATRAVDAEPKEYIRAATMIFYLNNDHWEPGDGGETGLYGAQYETENTDIRLAPPYNNSLLLFECSPHSYHRFVTNPGRTRNSIIIWFHAQVDDAVARWGNAINRPGSL